jgi:hypothetical protein
MSCLYNYSCLLDYLYHNNDFNVGVKFVILPSGTIATQINVKKMDGIFVTNYFS